MLMFRFGFDFISTKKSKQNQNLVLKNQNPTHKKSLSFDYSSLLFYISHAGTPLGSFSALAIATALTLDFDVNKWLEIITALKLTSL